jgi:hypothetical protein
MWKKIMEEEDKNSKLKVGINVAMVKWDQLVVDVCVTTRGQRASMPVEEPLRTKKGQSYKGLTNQMGEIKEGSFGCSRRIK